MKGKACDSISGDGDVADGVLKLCSHLVEGGGRDDGEDSLDDAVGAALVDEGRGLFKNLVPRDIRNAKGQCNSDSYAD
ncbi:hypothetical protein CsSME_00005272 [Camellia sinensis var. sinensis]